MVPVLNAIGVHCAVYGNHDFGKCHGLSLYTWDHISKHFDSMVNVLKLRTLKNNYFFRYS